jgi:hypothetical protein
MVERRRSTRFAAEALKHNRILRHIVWKELQGYEPAQAQVLGLLHHTHTAAAQLGEDAVVRNYLVNHWREILRCRNMQVNESGEVGGVPASRSRNMPLLSSTH